jgi:hypothetical protein
LNDFTISKKTKGRKEYKEEKGEGRREKGEGRRKKGIERLVKEKLFCREERRRQKEGNQRGNRSYLSVVLSPTNLFRRRCLKLILSSSLN